MANTAKNAILRAKIEGAIADLFVQSNVQNVWYDENTTLAAKLAEIISTLGTKATTDALTSGLAAKAEKVHTHAQSDVTGLEDALSARPTTDAMNSAISAAIDALINGAPETYNTLKEIADYIAEHEDVVETLNAAIGQKADKTTVEAIQETVDALGALANLDKVSEANLDDELKAKVNAAAEGNHSHANKALLDTYTQTETDLADAVSKKHSHSNKGVLDAITSTKVTNWDAAEQNAKDYADDLNEAMDTRVKAVEGTSHTHANKGVLDGITADNVASWNGKAKVYGAGESVDLAEGEIFIQLVD